MSEHVPQLQRVALRRSAAKSRYDGGALVAAATVMTRRPCTAAVRVIGITESASRGVRSRRRPAGACESLFQPRGLVRGLVVLALPLPRQEQLLASPKEAASSGATTASDARA